MTSTPPTAPTEALIDGLSRETGSVPNGPTLPPPRLPLSIERRNFGPITITRIGVPAWTCDQCVEEGRRRPRGRGTDDLLEHARRTGHIRYTPE